MKQLIVFGVIAVLTFIGIYVISGTGNTDVYPEIPLKYGYGYWLNTYDTVNFAVHDGMGYLHWENADAMAMDESEVLESLITMYDNTKDTKYLSLAVLHLDILKGYTSDSNGDGLLDWKAMKDSNRFLTTSRLAYPFIYFARVVRDNQAEAYYDTADEYQAFVVENMIPYWEQWWRPYTQDGQLYGRFYDEQESCGQYGAPHNRVSNIGRVYIDLWKLTGDEHYKDIAERMVRTFKAILQSQIAYKTVPSEPWVKYYTWHYLDRHGDWECDWCSINPSGWLCSGRAELVYSNYDIALALNAYENGIVFDKEDMELFANSFNMMLVRDAKVGDKKTPVLYHYVEYADPTPWTNPFFTTHWVFHWFRIGIGDYQVLNVAEEIMHNIVLAGELNGDYYSTYYECVTDLRVGNDEMCYSEADLQQSHPSHILLGISNMLRFN